MTDAPDSPIDEKARSAAQTLLDAKRATEHAYCLLCGKDNPIGFKLSFGVVKPGVVSASFPCSRVFQSYPQTLHGGVISALLDAAMTNCLFSLGETGVTAELTIRYLRPTKLDRPAEVVGLVETAKWPLFHLAGELRQDGAVLARAQAKFVDRGWAIGADTQKRDE